MNNKSNCGRKIVLSATACVCLMSSSLWGAILGGVTVEVVNDNAISSKVGKQHQMISRWPSASEKEGGAVAQGKILNCVPNFEQWARRSLSPKFIPTNVTAFLFGIRKWGADGGDVLFADYVVDGISIRIRDSATVFAFTIADNEFDANVDDWTRFLENFCTKYLAAAGRVTNFTAVYVTKCADSGICRINPTLPMEESIPPVTPWGMGNPTIWVDGKKVTVVVGKFLGGGFSPADSEYGVRQRFPPLRKVLENKPIDEVVGFLVDESASDMERSITASILLNKADSSSAIPALLAAHKNVKKDEIKTFLLQTLVLLSKKSGDSSVAEIREVLGKALAESASPRTKAILQRGLDDLKPDVRNDVLPEH